MCSAEKVFKALARYFFFTLALKRPWKGIKWMWMKAAENLTYHRGIRIQNAEAF